MSSETMRAVVCHGTRDYCVEELSIRGSHPGLDCYPAAIDAIATGAIDDESLISAEDPLEGFDEPMQAAMGGANLKTPLIP